MFVYGSEKHRAWLENEWKKSGKRLDMGKACVRIRKIEDVPLDVVERAVARVPVADYLAAYQAALAGREKPVRGAKAKPKPKKKNP
jgi:hypothetical protein